MSHSYTSIRNRIYLAELSVLMFLYRILGFKVPGGFSGFTKCITSPHYSWSEWRQSWYYEIRVLIRLISFDSLLLAFYEYQIISRLSVADRGRVFGRTSTAGGDRRRSVSRAGRTSVGAPTMSDKLAAGNLRSPTWFNFGFRFVTYAINLGI